MFPLREADVRFTGVFLSQPRRNRMSELRFSRRLFLRHVGFVVAGTAVAACAAPAPPPAPAPAQPAAAPCPLRQRPPPLQLPQPRRLRRRRPQPGRKSRRVCPERMSDPREPDRPCRPRRRLQPLAAWHPERIDRPAAARPRYALVHRPRRGDRRRVGQLAGRREADLQQGLHRDDGEAAPGHLLERRRRVHGGRRGLHRRDPEEDQGMRYTGRSTNTWRASRRPTTTPSSSS